MVQTTAHRLRAVANDPKARKAINSMIADACADGESFPTGLSDTYIRKKLEIAADERTEKSYRAVPYEEQPKFRAAVVQVVRDLVEKGHLVGTNSVAFPTMDKERGHTMTFLKMRDNGEGGSVLDDESGTFKEYSCREAHPSAVLKVLDGQSNCLTLEGSLVLYSGDGENKGQMTGRYLMDDWKGWLRKRNLNDLLSGTVTVV